MQWYESIVRYFSNLKMYNMTLNLGDVVEILLIAFLLYYILVWIKTTKAWSLLKGIIVIVVFLIIADIMHMTTILWMAQNFLVFAVTAIIVVLQPELRKALEELGNKSLWNVIPFDNSSNPQNSLSMKTLNEIVRACVNMAKVKTGALIVIEQTISLKEFESTGIELDAVVSSQLLENIFEHKTPLHDGAVLIRGDRIVSATCYLHLSGNPDLSKELGTRHRAGLGISEESDCLTIIVSEETGKISVAHQGKLSRNLDGESLRRFMRQILIKDEETKKRTSIWKGRSKAKQ